MNCDEFFFIFLYAFITHGKIYRIQAKNIDGVYLTREIEFFTA